MRARRLERVLLPAAAAALLLGAWQAAVKASGTTVFPSPAAVAAALAELFRKGLLFRYVRDSRSGFRPASSSDGTARRRGRPIP